MSWKKVNLFEYLGHHVFMDEYGFCRSEMIGIFINDINLSDLFAYKEESKRYERIRFGRTGDFVKDITDLFSMDIVRRKKTNQPYYNYDYGNDYLSSDQVASVKPKTIKINLRTRYYINYGYNSGSQEQYANDVIELNSAKDVTKYFCWYLKGADISSFKGAILPEVKVNDELYLVGTGKVTVSKLIDYPNDEETVCEVLDMEGKIHNIKMNSEVFYLPYDNSVNEYAILNKSLNELKLSPYVLCNKDQNHIYNIYWNRINDACYYHVILYKYLNLKNRRHILRLADYEIDRNTFFLSLDKLAGGDFIFKVTAEDRNGKIIAESRGLTDGAPRDFKK